MTSQDGINWKPQLAPEQVGWQSIVYADNKFVAVSGFTASCE
ncbi:hypothetical protein [Leptospira bouyouniensis]|nr:hypothetical protein [Leptospira bouyouniensis]